MISLTRRLKDKKTLDEEEDEKKKKSISSSSSLPAPLDKDNPDLNQNHHGRVSIRDKLLVKEVAEMESHLPAGSRVKFENPDVLSEFLLILSPEEGYWSGGKFRFRISVGEDYNILPPTVRCLTPLWHPNINQEGHVCLSLLRANSIDGLGWAPTRKLKDVVWGLNSLFTDLLNFEDPLNIEAAQHYSRDKEDFRKKVKHMVQKYAKR